MKRTKSMVYNKTAESVELFLVATNDSRLYFRQILPIINNLQKHFKRGNFDADKAIDAFYYAATAAAKAYFKDYGYMFTVGQRFTAAADMVDYYMESITECA